MSASGSAPGLDFVKSRVCQIDILGIHFFLTQPDTLANTINMKWITKEPPTLFFNGILTNSQLFCEFIKVPLISSVCIQNKKIVNLIIVEYNNTVFLPYSIEKFYWGIVN